MGKQHCRALGQSVLSLAGKKQDTWFIVDPKSGEKQTTLSTEAWDGVCPSSPLLYIGRTRKAAPPPPPPVGPRGCWAAPPPPWGLLLSGVVFVIAASSRLCCPFGSGRRAESGFLQQHAVALGSALPVCWGWNWHWLHAGSSWGISISPLHPRHRPHGTQ